MPVGRHARVRRSLGVHDLQKGDNFRPPKNGYERQRYMAEFLTGVPAPGGGKPQVKFIRQEVGQ